MPTGSRGDEAELPGAFEEGFEGWVPGFEPEWVVEVVLFPEPFEGALGGSVGLAVPGPG